MKLGIIINWCKFYIFWYNFFKYAMTSEWRHKVDFKIISVIGDSKKYLHVKPIELTLFC